MLLTRREGLVPEICVIGRFKHRGKSYELCEKEIKLRGDRVTTITFIQREGVAEAQPPAGYTVVENPRSALTHEMYVTLAKLMLHEGLVGSPEEASRLAASILMPGPAEFDELYQNILADM